MILSMIVKLKQENQSIYINNKDVSAVRPSRFDSYNNSIVILKNGTEIGVTGNTEEIYRQLWI